MQKQPTTAATSAAAPAKKHPLIHLIAGGAAGAVESSVLFPLDTIKTRMQLRAKGRSAYGPITTAQRIIKNEGFFSLYKGLTAVMAGIVPKMAVRFSSFDLFKTWLGCLDGKDKKRVFLAGLGSGVTEAVMVVTPAEVCKIRMQAQYHSMLDPEQMARRKYRNVIQTAGLIVKEEGIGALYKGVVPTTLRQGCNQAVNFSFYQIFKTKWEAARDGKELIAWQHMLIGGLSGGMGPVVNNPLDVVKTRLQRQVVIPGEVPKYRGLGQGMAVIAKEEGVLALWKGLTPRLLRIMPGQAITFATYEFVSKKIHGLASFQAPEPATTGNRS
ncbi:mitochondrial carrier domain-containing protein [Tribonema minus]|uniref:Mitochondrial carrier domain-containing protein n=1 Tax=Tribonema minus TaxID=303371 RepID=A0A836CM83_9STRA|nr:mitochondrial carrier domain-containing protein [Tribonema minus]